MSVRGQRCQYESSEHMIVIIILTLSLNMCFGCSKGSSYCLIETVLLGICFG